MASSSNNKLPLSDPLQTDNEPVFQAPWEARAFAMVNQLANTHRYSWSEWTDQFSQEITTAEHESTDTSSYYERWVRACEKLLVTKGILEPLAVDQRIEELLSERETTIEHRHLDK
ncbi:MAG: nitrile hydratase accessory protein [Cyanobacteria bacterium P01_C01_bin.118]